MENIELDITKDINRLESVQRWATKYVPYKTSHMKRDSVTPN